MIGYSHIELENYDAAEIALKKYIELTPDSSNPYDSYAELLLTLGKYDQSIEYYQEALDHLKNAFPDSPYDWYQTALAYEGLEKTTESSELYQRIANQKEVRLDLALVRHKAIAKL